VIGGTADSQGQKSALVMADGLVAADALQERDDGGEEAEAKKDGPKEEEQGHHDHHTKDGHNREGHGRHDHHGHHGHKDRVHHDVGG
jgi:hypothetical protein